MKTLALILTLAIGLVSCTPSIVVKDVKTGELYECSSNGMEDFVYAGDTALIKHTTSTKSLYATGSFNIPKGDFYTYEYNGDTLSGYVYYTKVVILKVKR